MTPRSPVRRIRPALVIAAALLQPAAPVPAAAADPGLSAFRARHGALWTLERDPGSGRPRRLAGGAVRWVDEARASAGGDELDRELLARARDFLRENAELLDLDPEALRPVPQGVLGTPGGRLRVLHFSFAPDGVPVLGARVSLAVAHGGLVYAHAVGTAPVAASARPSIGPAAALERALAAAGVSQRDVLRLVPPELYFLPVPGGHRLVWQVDFTSRGEPARRVARVDAATGELLELRDETTYACTPPPAGGTDRRVLAAVRGERADDPERSELVPLASVAGVPAGADGYFTAPPPPYAATLTGPAVRVTCSECTNPAAPAASAGPGGDVDFGAGGADASGNGRSTPADRTTYFHAETARRYASRWLSLPFLSLPLSARTNVNAACNAYWDGASITFFRSSPACANTGEIRDVIQHEFGHALDENDGLPPPSLSLDAATGEAAADAVALLFSRDACIGASFHRNPGSFPSSGCSGVRDLDEKAPGGRGTLGTGNLGGKCPTSGFYRGPLGYEGHCEGEVLGQALWHLARNLIDGVSYGDGSPLATGTLGVEPAWQLAEALYFDSRALLASYAPSTLQSIGTSAYDAFLVADDEGDGIGNGTRHAAAIHDAFAHHGIAELPAAPATTVPCAAPPDPAVTATAPLDPTSGMPTLRVAWSDSGAAAYTLLRAADPADGYVPIGSAGPGAGAIVDRGVLPGRTYLYRVVAEGASGCLSPGANPIAASPGPLLRVASVAIDDRFPGNGNGLLELGEAADLRFTLANDGSAAATAPSATLSSADPALVVTGAGPVLYPTLPPGGAVPAPAPFRVRADPGVPSEVVVTVSAEATEGCLRAQWLLRIARVDLAVAGQDLDDAAGGNGNGRWDAGETVALVVRLADVGLLDAAAVDGTIAFAGAPPPGITIVRDVAAWGLVAAGAPPVGSGPPTFALAADPTLRNRTRVDLTLDVRVAGVFERRFPLAVTFGSFPPGIEERVVDLKLIPDPIIHEIFTTSPLVLQLTDDDGDGAITRCDDPDVVLLAGDHSGGNWWYTPRLRAISMRDGSLLWESTEECLSVSGATHHAAGGDLDGDGTNEVVVANENGGVCAIGADGVLRWENPGPVEASQGRPSFNRIIAPVVADIDGDGTVEVVVGTTILRGSDGSVLWERSDRNGGRMLVADLDLDGRAEIAGGDTAVGSSFAYRADGSPHPASFPGMFWSGVVANLDADAYPEVAWLSWDWIVRAAEHDGTPIFTRTDLPPARGAGGYGALTTPLCAGDLDGDGRAEIGYTKDDFLIVLGPDGTTRWTAPIVPRWSSSISGCSIFDFEADGHPEVIIHVEELLTIYDGRDGEVLWQVSLPGFTGRVVPVVVDVDLDGSAEILVVRTDPFDAYLLHVYGNPLWHAARSVWNQEDYAVTNVEEDGSIPARPYPSWLTPGSSFRGQALVCPCSGPRPELSYSTPDCSASTVCFTAPVAGGRPPISFTWNFGDGSPEVMAEAPCHTFPGPGDYPVRVEVGDDNGCRDQAGAVVRIGGDLAADFALDPCAASPVCLTAAAAGGSPPYEVEWDFGDGSARATTASVCHAYPPGAYEIALFVRDAAGCTAEVRKQLGPGLPPQDVRNTLRAVRLGAEVDTYWAAVAGAADYNLRRDVTKPFAASVVVATVSGTSARDDPPASEAIHYYRVRARDCDGIEGP